MIITCCDSRILENTMFGGNVGDYFIHRNIANIVPSKNNKDQKIYLVLRFIITFIVVFTHVRILI